MSRSSRSVAIVLCLGCSTVSMDKLCSRCRRDLRAAPEKVLGSSLVVRSGSIHAGSARRLVHVLKYRGVRAAASVLAETMAPLVPDDVLLVPVPRVVWRTMRYGVDPAVELAAAVGSITGRPVCRLLRAPLWGRARAGGHHGFAPRFRVAERAPPDAPVLLVDDVVTSGATLVAAARLVPEAAGAVTATSAPVPESPTQRVTSLPGGAQSTRRAERTWRSWSTDAT